MYKNLKVVTHIQILHETYYKKYADSNTVCLLLFRKLAITSPEKTNSVS